MGQIVNGGYKLDYSGEEIDSRLSLLKNVSRQTALIGDTENNKARGANVTNAAAIGTGLEVSGYGLAFGKYNVHIPTPGHLPPGGQGYFIEEVGNGTDENNRSNARTLDWQGNMWTAGRQTMGALPTGAMDAVPRCLVTNPNLLDNAYFAGGGAGYGIFPVNQRGVTQYNGGNAKIFDRWMLGAGGGTADLLADGVKLTFSGAAWQNLTQIVENGAALAGEIVTFSALVNTTVDLPVRLRWASGGSNYAETIPAGTNGLYSFNVAIGSTVDSLSVSIGSLSTAIASGYFTLKAVKLERGSIQTLAHQESSEWVLNSIPRYDEELRKCQAYLRPIPKYTMIRASSVRTNYIDFCLPLGTPMSGKPELVGVDGNATIQDFTGGNQSGFTFSTVDVPGFAYIRATKTAHGMSDAVFNVDATIFLSAEL